MNTKVDEAFDKFEAIIEIYQMNIEDLDEFQDRIEKRIYGLRLGAIETKADRELEMRSDSEEEPFENDDNY